MIVIRDTREKVGYWDFTHYDECEGQIVQTLKTGDYAIYGHEQDIIVDRKATTGELAINLGSKFKQFEAEMKRMENFKERYIVCEFSLNDILNFPLNSKVPANKLKFIRMNGKFMLLRISQLEQKYGVKFLLCGDVVEAQKIVMELFKNAIKNAK